MVIATSERRRGASPRSALSASFTDRSAGMITWTRRCPQSGAGDTSSTNRSFKPSSACRSASARFSARCTCRQNCRAFRSTCLPDDRRSDAPRPMLGQTVDRRNLLIPSDDDCDVSRRSSPAAQGRAAGLYADTYAVAVNLVVVESDGSRPDRPDYLGGGEQARRHRAACNRGHGLLRCCVESRWRWCLGATGSSIIARDRGPRKIAPITDSKWHLEQT